MKKLTVTMWITLDGFIASSDGGMGWLLGDYEMSKYEIGVVSDADTLLLGRKTYWIVTRLLFVKANCITLTR